MFTGCKPSWSYFISHPGQSLGELQTSLFFVLVLFCLPLPFLCSVCVSQPNWQLLSFLNCTQVKLEVRFHSTVMLTHVWEMKYQNVFTAHRLCASAPKLCCLQQLGVSIRTGCYSCVWCVVTGSSLKAERYEPIKGFYEDESRFSLGFSLCRWWSANSWLHYPHHFTHDFLQERL